MSHALSTARVQILDQRGNPRWTECGHCHTRVKREAYECPVCLRALFGVTQRVKNLTRSGK